MTWNTEGRKVLQVEAEVVTGEGEGWRIKVGWIVTEGVTVPT